MKRLWLVRLGRNGEFESRALEQSVLTIHFGMHQDLGAAKTRDAILPFIAGAFPDAKAARQRNFAAQVNQFVNTMEVGDIVVCPIKTLGCIAIGEVSGPYMQGDDGAPSRPVKWLAREVQRSAFKQDLLYSFGAIMTVCEIKRNDALARVLAVVSTGTDPGYGAVVKAPKSQPDVDEESFGDDETINLGQLARDQIIARISSVFTGHDLTTLVEAILIAQGYVTHRSPPGADGGYDIVAGRGALGFEPPRLVVQVKSGGIVADAPMLQSLNGCITDAKADQGLLVSWGGFKPTVHKRTNELFFRVRFWGQEDLITALLAVYDKLPEEIRAALPLQRVWALVPEEDEVAA